MGNAVARSGDKINDSIAPNHITVREWEPNGDRQGYWEYDEINATVSGTINEGNSKNVYVNGISVAVVGSHTLESDSYSSSWDYYSGQHINATSGAVSSGSSTVFIGGVPVARVGDSVNTHANTSTTISQGSSNVFVG